MDQTGTIGHGTGIVVDKAGDLYIVDSQHHRVREYGPAFAFVGSQWGGQGVGGRAI